MYAFTNVPIPGKRRANGKQAYRRVSMHRMLLDVPPGHIGEHRNRNGLDNQRANLRICTQRENNANKIGWGRSGYKGVQYVARYPHRPWLAVIQKDRKLYTIGYFASPEEAARAYDAAAVAMFGEYAHTNF